MRSNQLRLYLSAVAYELMHANGVCKGNVWNGADRGAGSGERARVHVALATGYPYMNDGVRAGPEGEPAV